MSDVVQTAPPVVKMDGREARSQANRSALIAAGMRLIERDNNWSSAAPEIAAEAGVSLRTFFNHFTTVEYFREVLIKEYEPALRTYLVRFIDPMVLIRTLMK